MTTRQISLFVKDNYTLPDVYTKGTIEEVEEALSIGAAIQNSVKTQRSTSEIRKITELKDAEIAKIQEIYTQKIKQLLDEIRNINVEKDKISSEYTLQIKESRKGERDIVTHEWEEKMRLLRKEHEILQGRYETLENRRHILEESRDTDIHNATKRTEELMQKIINSKQDQLTVLNTSYDNLNRTIVKQTEEFAKLTNSFNKRSTNVKTKGSDYEEQFSEKIRRNYGMCSGFTMKDTRLGMGHEMDLSTHIEGHVILWELKNYTSTVPKTEVDKFLRDLKENSHATVGVMISRCTDIYSKQSYGYIHTEFDNNKMIIYINRFEEFCADDESRIFQILLCLFRIWWEYSREEHDMFNRVELIREIEKAVEDISKRRIDWRRHRSHMDELGRWISDLLDESETRLDNILKKARNKSDTVYNCDKELIIPSDVFRDSREEKEISWIKSIMSLCECGGEIEVRELVELLGKHHKLSKDTIRSNIMSIIKDSAVLKKGVVKYIKGISKYVPPCQIKM